MAEIFWDTNNINFTGTNIVWGDYDPLIASESYAYGIDMNNTEEDHHKEEGWVDTHAKVDWLNLDAYAMSLDYVISESVKVQVPYTDFSYARAEAKASRYAYFMAEGSGILTVSFDYSLGQMLAIGGPIEFAEAEAHV